MESGWDKDSRASRNVLPDRTTQPDGLPQTCQGCPQVTVVQDVGDHAERDDGAARRQYSGASSQLPASAAAATFSRPVANITRDRLVITPMPARPGAISANPSISCGTWLGCLART